MTVDLGDWRDLEETRAIMTDVRLKIDKLTRRLLLLAETGTLDEIRQFANQRKGLYTALKIMEGKKDDESPRQNSEDAED
jgi:acetyl-CoA carboxylase carboxyltransferase component